MKIQEEGAISRVRCDKHDEDEEDEEDEEGEVTTEEQSEEEVVLVLPTVQYYKKIYRTGTGSIKQTK